MSVDPWLSIIGWNEDSAAALPPATRALLKEAEVVFGGPRHLEQAGVGARGQAWFVPFSVAPVLALRGQSVVILASGDPFWHGAGGSITKHLAHGEWRAYPAPSTFSLAANGLGWRMEETTCHGLHAAPYARLRSVLAPHGQMICLLRDGAAPAELAAWLVEQGAGAAELFVMEALGGGSERIRQTTALGFDLTDVQAPVCAAVKLPAGVGISRASGLADDLFASDGQITKRPVRALTLSALAPRRGEVLWDLGAGSGSISVEWCLAGGRAEACELAPARAGNITSNADRFGLQHLMNVHIGNSLELTNTLPRPDAVFIGGGASAELFASLFAMLPQGTRLVANGVTLETEALLTQMQGDKGGALLRIELAQAAPLGGLRGWQSARPVVQWSVVL